MHVPSNSGAGDNYRLVDDKILDEGTESRREGKRSAM